MRVDDRNPKPVVATDIAVVVDEPNPAATDFFPVPKVAAADCGPRPRCDSGEGVGDKVIAEAQVVNARSVGFLSVKIAAVEFVKDLDECAHGDIVSCTCAPG